MKTRAERLNWAIEHHGPGDRSPRAFQVASKPHVGRVRSSWYAVQRYLAGEREIYDAYLDGAVEVLGPVRAEWLKDGTGPRVEGGEAATPSPATDTRRPTVPPEKPWPPINDPWADIRRVVEMGGEDPVSDALADLDPKYPRNGLTVRNWRILHAVVCGADTKDVAAEVELSEARVRSICDEYRTLVRAAAGIDE